MVPELNLENYRLMIFNRQCINLRNYQKNNYYNLRREVDYLQNKLAQDFNSQNK